MKVKKIVALTVLFLSAVVFGTIKFVNAQSVSSHRLRYETGLLWAQQYESVVGEVVNFDSIPHDYRIVIYQQLIPSPVFDSGVVLLPGGGTMAVGAYTLPASNVSNFLIEITVDSDRMIPSASIGVPGGCFPCNPPRVILHGSQLTQFKQQF